MDDIKSSKWQIIWQWLNCDDKQATGRLLLKLYSSKVDETGTPLAGVFKSNYIDFGYFPGKNR